MPDTRLEETISIEGTLLMLDDVTPHVAVPVQAVRDEEVIATTLSDEGGKYRFIGLDTNYQQVAEYRAVNGYETDEHAEENHVEQKDNTVNGDSSGSSEEIPEEQFNHRLETCREIVFLLPITIHEFLQIRRYRLNQYPK